MKNAIILLIENFMKQTLFYHPDQLGWLKILLRNLPLSIFLFSIVANWIKRKENVAISLGRLVEKFLSERKLVEFNTDQLSIFSFSRYRKIALVIILTRAGLDLDPDALKKLRITVPKLGLIPWVVETLIVAILTKYLLGLPWIWGFLLGSVIAAVSPAVVVPCLFRLRSKGYGVAKVRISS